MSLAERWLSRVPAVLVRVAPFAILVVLSTITVLVWRDQLTYEQQLLRRHTEDIAMQSAQRLEDMIEGHLRVAAVMAWRWAEGERSRDRFEAFAELLTRELRVFESVAVLAPDLGSGWMTPHEPEVLEFLTGASVSALLTSLSPVDRLVISPPDDRPQGHGGFHVLMPLEKQGAGIGYLAVHFHAAELVRQCFHQQILDEFEVAVNDGAATLFHSSRPPAPPTPQTRLMDALDPAPRVGVDLTVRNRRWRLTMQPLVPARTATWTRNLAVPRLGLLMAAALSVAAYLLLSRMRKYQQARDAALAQVAVRRRVEEALRRSEARYRDVFASASDGLVVLDGDGKVLEANTAAGGIAGLPPEGMLGRPLQDFFGRECDQRCRQFLGGDAPAMPRLEAVVARGDGQRLDVEMRATRLRQGESARALVIVTDVTERKRALERHALLSRKVLMAQEEERARVSRELHDELGQLLTALRLEMGWFKKRIDNDAQVDMEMFHEAVKLVERAADESRRICKGLRPPLLDDLGLEPAVRLLVDEFKEHSQVRTSLVLDVDEEVIVPLEAALCTYRILQESLTNVSRHARASNAEVLVRVTAGLLQLQVIDDGQGFDPDDRHGCGIEGMSERANLVNGMLTIQSSPGSGTRVSFSAKLPRTQQEQTA